MTIPAPRPTLSLWDYRRRVADLYTLVRSLPPEEGWHEWCRRRDLLFASHSQSPIPADERDAFSGVPYYEYRDDLRVPATVVAGSGGRVALPHSGAGSTPAGVFGLARFAVGGTDLTLEMYRLEAYGDAVFVPFGDATNGDTTYAAGRYLIDTAKGADLGSDEDGVVFDFNFAYHPSCVHDPRWSCPLRPRANILPFAIEAGERLRNGS